MGTTAALQMTFKAPEPMTCYGCFGSVNHRFRPGVTILVSTPGRLLGGLQNKSLSLQNVRYVPVGHLFPEVKSAKVGRKG